MVVLSTDNLILSRYVGLAAVGLYANYYLITDALNKIIDQVFNSVVASVGNLNASAAENDKGKLEKTFDRIFFLTAWIYGFCACCLWVLFNPFISLWLGDSLTFDKFTVLIIVINFHLYGMRKAALTFRTATGAFYYDRYRPLAESAINIIASIVLAKRMGTAGVFLGTIISTVTTCIWVEPYVLYKHVFHKKADGYAIAFLAYTAVTVFACLATTLVSGMAHMENVYAAFVVKLTVCLIVPNLIFLAFFCRTDRFQYFVELGRKLLYRLRARAQHRPKHI